VVGDTVSQVVQASGTGVGGDLSADFEGTISVVDQIQQLTTNLAGVLAIVELDVP